MDLKEFSKWLWDVAKYVLTAVIISSFLGKFSDNATIFYITGFSIVLLLFGVGTYMQILTKKQSKS